jgi:RnfABCDGE-type electron transport complex B subunit
MNYVGIIIAIAIVAAVGLFIGIFLGIAANIFKVEVDERQEKIEATLPGNNCGGCGYPGCSGCAAAIVKGEAPVNACPVGGAQVAKKVGEIMGVKAEEGKRMVAFVKCQGDCDKTHDDYHYTGQKDCQMIAFIPNQGPKSCNSGCQGYGTCVSVCPFDAIHVVNGVAKVDKEACKACGKCIAACPRQLIELIPYDAMFAVACSSASRGPQAMKECTASCIACGMCAKNCPAEAITVENMHAHIDYEKCIECGTCREKCKRNSIILH